MSELRTVVVVPQRVRLSGSCATPRLRSVFDLDGIPHTCARHLVQAVQESAMGHGPRRPPAWLCGSRPAIPLAVSLGCLDLELRDGAAVERALR
jgi:hypothetical protein